MASLLFLTDRGTGANEGWDSCKAREAQKRPGSEPRSHNSQESGPHSLLFGGNHSLFIHTVILNKQKPFQKTKTSKNGALTPKGERREVRRERWTQRMVLVPSFPRHTLPGTPGKRLFHKLTLREKRGSFLPGIQNSEDKKQG